MPRRPLLFVAVGALWLLLAGAPAAGAQAAVGAGPVRFEWSREASVEGCPDAEWLRNGVRDRLGRDPFTGAPVRTIEGHVHREGGVLVTELVVRTTDGLLVGDRRLRIDEPTCDSLAQAVVLAVALIIDPDAPMTVPPPEISSDSEESRAQTIAGAAQDVSGGDEEAAAPPRDAEPSAPRLPTGTLVAAAAVGAGMLPSVGVGAMLIGSVDLLSWLALEAAVSFWPEQRGIDAGFGLTSGQLGLCFVPELAQPRLMLCVHGALGALHQVVLVPEPVAPGQRLWASVALAAASELRIAGPFVVRVGVEVSLPLLRDTFVTEGGATVFEPSVVCGVGHFGIGARFD